MSDTAEVLKVHKDELAGRYLTFTLGENIYGVELMKVIDIITIQAITSVPYVPEYVKGIINLRGKIIPVIDMRIKFGLPPVGYDDRTCIIVIEMERIQVGMIVDTVSEVLTFDSESLSLIPEFDRYNNNKFLSSIGRTGEKLVMNLNCRKIFVDNSGY
jgi:purine-binding chemotaxis protein CheW